MKIASLPSDEEARLQKLMEYLIVDTPAEEIFDHITQLAAAICGTSIATITLITRDRQWFKSTFNLNSTETKRDISFCAHTILGKEILEVSDTLEDKRFFDNPLVTGTPKIRFYAGAPLATPSGHHLGALCVIDHEPKVLSPFQKEQLAHLGKIVESLFDTRKLINRQEIENWRIQESNRLKDVLLNNMSHELFTPLNAIIGYADLLSAEDGELPISESKEYLGQILASSRYLLQIIQSILAFSTSQFTKIAFHFTKANFAEDINAVIAELHGQAVEKQNKISVTISEDLGPGYLDQYWFRQILHYYLSNATKFTNIEGKIHIRLSPAVGEKLLLEVEDNGIGIKSEDLKKLFVPFQQMDSSVTKRYAGIGLSLALAKKVLEAQGGEVGVSSVLGKGSVFSATIQFLRRLPEKLS